MSTSKQFLSFLVVSHVLTLFYIYLFFTLFQCFAKFAAKETLNRHVKTHTALKPHSCEYCGKTFIQISQLRAHLFHHTGI